MENDINNCQINFVILVAMSFNNIVYLTTLSIMQTEEYETSI